MLLLIVIKSIVSATLTFVILRGLKTSVKRSPESNSGTLLTYVTTKLGISAALDLGVRYKVERIHDRQIDWFVIEMGKTIATVDPSVLTLIVWLATLKLLVIEEESLTRQLILNNESVSWNDTDTKTMISSTLKIAIDRLIADYIRDTNTGIIMNSLGFRLYCLLK